MAESNLSECILIVKTAPQNLDGNGTVAEVYVKPTSGNLTICKISLPDEEVRTIQP